MLKAEDYPDGTAIYSFVADDGTNTHVDSEKLRQWCAENRLELEVVLTPVREEYAKGFLIEDVVDSKHVQRVLEMERLDPVIYGITGYNREGHPDVLLIDGHHRYVAAAVLRMEAIPAYVLEPAQWRSFQIEGLPDLTKELLRRMPTKPRG